MTNQIERLQTQFYNLNIDQKREFIVHMQDKLQYSNDPEWRAYIQPFISRCIAEYNEEIKRPVAYAPTPTQSSTNYCACGFQLDGDEKFCDRCGQPVAPGAAYDSGGYPAPTAPAYAPQPPQPPVSAPTAPPYGGPSQPRHMSANPPPSNGFEGALDGITNAIPVAGNTVLYVTSILLVILGGIGLMVNVLMPLEALQRLDIAMSLVGLTWLQLYMLEGGLIIFRLIVGVMGIVCSMRPDMARRCRTLGIVLFSYRAIYLVIVWFAMMDLPREVTAAARGSNMLMNILGWILPLVYILAAHKAIGASDKTA